jgi:hypothetical protein
LTGVSAHARLRPAALAGSPIEPRELRFAQCRLRSFLGRR